MRRLHGARSFGYAFGYTWGMHRLSAALLLLGLLVCFLGVFVAMPVCFTAFGLAYRFLQAKKGMAAAGAA